MRTLKTWTLRLACTAGFLVALLVGIVLNPGVLYAHKTVVGGWAIYHNDALPPGLAGRLEAAAQCLRASELYDPSVRLQLCLQDGNAAYSSLIRALLGPAFGWGFAHTVVLGCLVQATENRAVLNGYTWNLTQLITHEGVHCLQFRALGLFGANPLGGYPSWKWEGYPEYVARQMLFPGFYSGWAG